MLDDTIGSLQGSRSPLGSNHLMDSSFAIQEAQYNIEARRCMCSCFSVHHNRALNPKPTENNKHQIRVQTYNLCAPMGSSTHTTHLFHTETPRQSGQGLSPRSGSLQAPTQVMGIRTRVHLVQHTTNSKEPGGRDKRFSGVWEIA